MKKILDAINSLGFTFSFRRVRKAILLITIFVIIGVSVHLFDQFIKSEAGQKILYSKEISKNFDIDGNSIIRIYKEDINEDNKSDYFFIMGQEKRTSDNALNSVVEQYNNVSFVIIDGNTNEAIQMNSKMEFKADVTLKLYKDNSNTYFLISDENGDIKLYKYLDNKLNDIIAGTTKDEFLGYTIYTTKNDEKNKIKISIDNYSKDYLGEYKDTKTLDFNDMDISIQKYRETYLRDRFSDAVLEDIDNDGTLEFVANQYVLYSLDNSTQDNKTLGVVKTVFDIKKSKLKFKKVDIGI